MSLTRTVYIARLYPSNVEDLAKTFRNAESVHNPNRLSRSSSMEISIQDLINEIEPGIYVEDDQRRNETYPTNLDAKIDAVNFATTHLTSDSSNQIPEDIRGIQLAHLYEPEVDGQKYHFGLMSHRGNYNPELAVLIPYKKDRITPTLILSNNWTEDLSKGIRLITKALAYSREKPTE
ncbi:MAG: hypothetical protein ACMXYE_03485 [Candidatus Woesearchaeota archaeon]